MGSVATYYDCPYCKSKETCWDDFYYKSGEEYMLCSECGYYYSRTIKRDKKGNAVKDKDGDYVFETIHIEKPYGLLIITRNGKQSLQTIRNKKHLAMLIKGIDDLWNVRMNRFVKGKIIKEDYMVDPPILK